MFSSPSLRLPSHENAESLLARKPGLNHTVTRKALQDRDVNKKTLQSKNKALKTNINIFTDTTQTEPKVATSTDLLLDLCSYKDIQDNYEDIEPMNKRLNRRDILHTLTAFQKAKKKKEKIVVDVKPFEVDTMIFEVPAMNDLVFNFAGVDELELNEVPLPDIHGFD